MKRLLGLLVCLTFVLSVQTVYSHPLQTDYKAGITTVIQPLQTVSDKAVYQSAFIYVAVYTVQMKGVIPFKSLIMKPCLNENLNISFITDNKNWITRKQYSSINLPRIRHVTLNRYCFNYSCRHNYRFNKFC